MFEKFLKEIEENGSADLRMLIDYSNYRSFLTQYQKQKIDVLVQLWYVIEGTIIKKKDEPVNIEEEKKKGIVDDRLHEQVAS